MILVLDNIDSFTFNLVQLVRASLLELSRSDEVVVRRNDELLSRNLRSDLRAYLASFDKVLIGPGPGRPEDAGATMDVLEALSTLPEVEVLGVCLGQQAMALFEGGKVRRADRVMHGKTSVMRHDGRGLFRTLTAPTFAATRYHSLVVDADTLPAAFEASCFEVRDDGAGELMGIRHHTLPWESVQFHPESFLCDAGPQLMSTWLTMPTVFTFD